MTTKATMRTALQRTLLQESFSSFGLGLGCCVEAGPSLGFSIHISSHLCNASSRLPESLRRRRRRRHASPRFLQASPIVLPRDAEGNALFLNKISENPWRCVAGECHPLLHTVHSHRDIWGTHPAVKCTRGQLLEGVRHEKGWGWYY